MRGCHPFSIPMAGGHPTLTIILPFSVIKFQFQGEAEHLDNVHVI
jgi:hypothetical protein